MSIIECVKCEYYEPRQDYCYIFKNKPTDKPCEMNEALKKTALYQWDEYGKAIEEMKQFVKEEFINLVLKIKRFIKRG